MEKHRSTGRKAIKDYKKSLQDKIARILDEKLSCTMRFSIDFVAIDSSHLYFGSNNWNSKSDPLGQHKVSKVFKYHIYDNQVSEFFTHSARITHLLMNHTTNSIIVGYDNTAFYLIDCKSQNKICLFKSTTKTSHIVSPPNGKFLFYSTHKSLYQVDASDKHYHTYHVCDVDNEIVKFEVMIEPAYVVILTSAKQLYIYSWEEKKFIDLSNYDFSNVSDVVVHESQSKFAVKINDEVSLWYFEPSKFYCYDHLIQANQHSVDLFAKDSETTLLTRKAYFDEGIAYQQSSNLPNLSKQQIKTQDEIEDEEKLPLNLDYRESHQTIKSSEEESANEHSLSKSVIESVHEAPRESYRPSKKTSNLQEFERHKVNSFIVKNFDNYGNSDFKMPAEPFELTEYVLKQIGVSTVSINKRIVHFNSCDKILMTSIPHSSENENHFRENSLQALLSYHLHESFEYSSTISTVQFCPKSKWLVMVDRDCVNFKIANLDKSHKIVFDYNLPFKVLHVDEDELNFFTWNRKEIRKWNLESKACIDHWIIPRSENSEDTITHVFLSKATHLIFCATSSNIYKLSKSDLSAIDNNIPIASGDFRNAIVVYCSFGLYVFNIGSEKLIWRWKDLVPNSQLTNEIIGKKHVTVAKPLEKHKIIVTGNRDGGLILFNKKLVVLRNVEAHKNPINYLINLSKNDRIISVSSESIHLWTMPDAIWTHKAQNNDVVDQMVALNKNIFVCKLNSGVLKFYNSTNLNLIYEWQSRSKKERDLEFIAFMAKNDMMVMVYSNMLVKLKPFTSPYLPRIQKAIKESKNGLIKTLDLSENLYHWTGGPELEIYDKLSLIKKCRRNLNIDRDILEISVKYGLIFTANKKGLIVSDIKTLTPLQVIFTSSPVVKIHVIENLDAVCIIYHNHLVELRRLPKFLKIAATSEFQLSAMCVNQYEEVLYLGTEKGKLYAWRPEQRPAIVKFGHHSEKIRHIAVSESNHLLFTCSKYPVEIKVWNTVTLSQFHTIYNEETFTKIIFKENMNIFLAITSAKKLMFWDLKTFENIDINVPFLENAQVVDIACSNLDHNLFIKYIDEHSGGKLTVCDLSQLYKLSFLEKIYVRELFLGKTNSVKFIMLFSKLKEFYRQSYLLKKFFNIYLAIAMRENKNEFIPIFRDEKEPLDFKFAQISPFQYLVNSNQIERLQNVLIFLAKKKVSTIIDEKFMEFVLKRADLAGLAFLAQNYIVVEKFSEWSSKFEKLGNFKSFSLLRLSTPQFTDVEHKMMKDDQKKTDQINVEIYDMCVKWDFTAMTDTSILFLQAYSESENDAFILSPYRHIITHKWKTIYKLIVLHTLLFWSHILFYSLFILNRHSYTFLTIDAIILSLLFLFEIVDISANKLAYFNNTWNFFDLTSLIVCSIFLTMGVQEKDHWDDSSHKLLLVISLGAVTLRGFTFFKVFSQYSHITQMIIGMMQHSVSILFLIAYFCICLAVQISTVQEKKPFAENLRTIYDLIFGGVPDFDDSHYLFIILIVTGSILVPIFMINFLIAKLSGTYSELENRQKVLSFKEMAESVHECEILGRFIMRFFGYSNTAKLGYVYLGVDKAEVDEADSIGTTEDLIEELSKDQKEQHDRVVDQLNQLIEKTKEVKREQKEQFREQQKLLIEQNLMIVNQLTGKDRKSRLGSIPSKMQSEVNI